jgi:serine/threonine protein kinase
MSRTERKHTMVRVDVDAIERAISKSRFSRSSLAEAAGLNRDTIYALLEKGEVRDSTFEAVVKALGGEANDYLADPSPVTGRPRSPYGLPPTEEWEVDDSIPCSDWVKAANGLQYRICRMRHLTIENHLGRGKFYDLLGVRKDLRDELKHQLERHAVVGATVGANPNVSQLYSCVRVGDGEGWWVVDRWIEGSTLEHRLQSGPWPRSDLPRLMKELLNGLAALHSHSIVLREMTPARVLIPEGKRPPILTDFEMAKFFNGAPTVRNGVWPRNPFRAPEVESGQVGPSADLFSWAVMLLNAATGIAPDERRLKEAVVSAKLPAQVTEVVKKCLSSSPSRRPDDCESVRRALRKWS